jgi:hypothetical protein
MEMKKKGMVITFDAGLAIFLVISIILISSFYITKGDRSVFPKVQIVRNMQDTVIALDNNKTLQTLNLTLIENRTATLLGRTYNFSIFIEEYNSSFDLTRNFTIKSPTDRKTFVNSGNYIFVKINNTANRYYLLRYWVWENE